MTQESKKEYVVKGKIVGTYESDTVDIDISLSDSELERIKVLIKSSDSKDLRWVIQDEFPELYEQINGQLQDAAYDYYAQEYKDYFSESEDDEEDPNDIEQLVAENNKTVDETEVDEDAYMPIPSLLTILEENDKDLFIKFWNIIMPPVFVEFLIDAFNNGDIEEHEDDNFYDYHKADFDKLYEMYGDDIELEHSSCCICMIPEELHSQYSR